MWYFWISYPYIILLLSRDSPRIIEIKALVEEQIEREGPCDL
jgi:hypothetical protein